MAKATEEMEVKDPTEKLRMEDPTEEVKLDLFEDDDDFEDFEFDLEWGESKECEEDVSALQPWENDWDDDDADDDFSLQLRRELN